MVSFLSHFLFIPPVPDCHILCRPISFKRYWQIGRSLIEPVRSICVVVSFIDSQICAFRFSESRSFRWWRNLSRCKAEFAGKFRAPYQLRISTRVLLHKGGICELLCENDYHLSLPWLEWGKSLGKLSGSLIKPFFDGNGNAFFVSSPTLGNSGAETTKWGSTAVRLSPGLRWASELLDCEIREKGLHLWLVSFEWSRHSGNAFFRELICNQKRIDSMSTKQIGKYYFSRWLKVWQQMKQALSSIFNKEVLQHSLCQLPVLL